MEKYIADVRVSEMNLIFFTIVVLFSSTLSSVLRKMEIKNFYVLSVFFSTASMCIRSLLVSFKVEDKNTKVLYSTQLLLSLGAAMSLVCPPFLSVLWFPPAERRFATGILMSPIYLGLGVSFIIGNYEMGCHTDVLTSRKTFPEVFEVQLMASTAVFVVIALFFPYKPKNPPNILNLSQRLSFRGSWKMMAKNRYLWIGLMSGGMVTGSFFFFTYQSGWIFKEFGIISVASRDFSFFIETASCLVGCFLVSIALFKISDQFFHLFPFMAVSCVIFSASLLSVTLLLAFFRDHIPHTTVKIILIVFGVISCSIIFAVSPLYAEFISDFMYPVPEEMIFSLFMRALFLIPVGISSYEVIAHARYSHIFAKVVLFLLTGCSFVGTILILLMSKVENKRMKVDFNARKPNSTHYQPEEKT